MSDSITNWRTNFWNCHLFPKISRIAHPSGLAAGVVLIIAFDYCRSGSVATTAPGQIVPRKDAAGLKNTRPAAFSS